MFYHDVASVIKALRLGQSKGPVINYEEGYKMGGGRLTPSERAGRGSKCFSHAEEVGGGGGSQHVLR